VLRNDRMRALAPHAGDNVREQHVVSRIILKRFVGTVPHRRAGSLEVIDLRYPEAKPTYSGPRGCGRIDNFVRYASRSLEQLWGTVENRLDRAIAACDDRSVFAHPEHVKTLKDAIVVHLVRSVQTRPFLDKIWEANLAGLRAAMRDRPDVLARAFVRRYGMYPGGPEGLGLVLDDALRPSFALKDADAFFRESLERLFNLGSEYLEARGLEVSRPAAGEFVISDAPAAAVGTDGRIGLLQGVGINSATTVALPLGPGLLVSTGDADGFQQLSQEYVAEVNRWQVHGASQHVYCRPGSGLYGTIRALASLRP
jgi:hypothetical protein